MSVSINYLIDQKLKASDALLDRCINNIQRNYPKAYKYIMTIDDEDFIVISNSDVLTKQQLTTIFEIHSSAGHTSAAEIYI